MRRLFVSPVRVGWLATGAIFGIAVWAGFSDVCEGKTCRSKFELLSASRPNEIGDALAGFAGTLAFVWIIVTVWLQSQELAAQREELKLTRDEMEGQRKATQEMALAMSAQTHVFQDEMKQREQLRAEELLGQKLDRLKRVANWLFISATRLDNEEIARVGEHSNESASDSEWQICTNIRNVMVAILGTSIDDVRDLRRGPADDFSYTVVWVQEIFALLSDISEMQFELSAGQVQRLYNIEFDELFDLTGRATSHLFDPDSFVELSGEVEV